MKKRPPEKAPIEKMMAYLDGEMAPRERKEFEKLLDQHPDWREEVESMTPIVNASKRVHIRRPDDSAWDHYWEEIDSQLQRRFGWVFGLVGSIVLIVWGFLKILLASENSIVRMGLILFAVGILTLFWAALRGRLLEIPKDRYHRIRK